MLVRLLGAAGVITLAASSGYANYTHVQHMGVTIIGLVIGAEVFKFCAPIFMVTHAKNKHAGRWLATFALWLVVVVFSFANTFGNALTRHATEQARLEHVAAGAVRPEHVVLKEIGQLPACRNGRCTQTILDRRKALLAELKVSQASKNHVVVAKGDPVRDGFVTLAAMVGIELPRERIFAMVTLIWTILAEFGSAFGVLAVPRKETP